MTPSLRNTPPLPPLMLLFFAGRGNSTLTSSDYVGISAAPGLPKTFSEAFLMPRLEVRPLPPPGGVLSPSWEVSRDRPGLPFFFFWERNGPCCPMGILCQFPPPLCGVLSFPFVSPDGIGLLFCFIDGPQHFFPPPRRVSLASSRLGVEKTETVFPPSFPRAGTSLPPYPRRARFPHALTRSSTRTPKFFFDKRVFFPTIVSFLKKILRDPWHFSFPCTESSSRKLSVPF